MKDVNTISWRSDELMKKYEKGTLRFDSYVQRNKCWNKEQKSLLIRTILNGFPRIPEIYVTKQSTDKAYQCLDGQQRITTVIDYMSDLFPLEELEPVVDDDGNEYELTGKKFSDLPEVLKNIIITFSWRAAFYADLTDDEIAELFYLINNAKPLSTMEHVRCVSPSLKIMQEIGKHELFTKSLTAKAFEKYKEEELVCKSYMMLNMDEPCLDKKFFIETMKTAILTDEDKNTLNEIYDRILDIYKRLIADVSKETEKISKKAAKRIISRTHMFSIIPILKKSIDENVDIDLFTKWISSFFSGTKKATKYDKYNNNVTVGSSHKESIKARLSVIDDDYKKFMIAHKYDAETKNEVEESVDPIDSLDEEASSVMETQNESETDVA